MNLFNGSYPGWNPLSAALTYAVFDDRNHPTPPASFFQSHKSAFRPYFDPYGGNRSELELLFAIQRLLACTNRFTAVARPGLDAQSPYTAPFSGYNVPIPPNSEMATMAVKVSKPRMSRSEKFAVALKSVAGMKIPIRSNECPGVLCMDTELVYCHCKECNSRAAAGSPRPIFSLTRFERHTGSKAKKWRLSLKIEPGAVPECPASSAPMPLGHWLEIKGLRRWGKGNGTYAAMGYSPSTSDRQHDDLVATGNKK